MKSKLQFRDIRKLRDLTTEKLLEFLEDINQELIIYNASKFGYSNSKLRSGKSPGSVDWGRCKQLKKGKARILTILNERKIKVI